MLVKNGMTETMAVVHVEIEGHFGESTNGSDSMNAGLSVVVNGAGIYLRQLQMGYDPIETPIT